MLDLLKGVRVLESSLFSPDALGGHLADLGAEVIKVDQPGGGGFRGPMFALNNMQDLQWNRGKKSVQLDLKSLEGQSVFLDLARNSHVVINGLRRGAAERLGFGYDDIVKVNPSVVYCTINGMGNDGPYAELPTHGLSFDCFAGLTPPVIHADGTPRLPGGAGVGIIGVTSGPIYGALAVVAALHRATADRTAQHVEVSQVDAAIVWNFQKLTALANDIEYHGDGIRDSLRYQYYETGDGHYVVLMAMEDKFWLKFCEAVDRMDLYEPGKVMPGEDPALEAKLRDELATIFKSRSRAEWIEFFIEADVAGAPAFLGADLFDNDHFKTRELLYEQVLSDGETMRLVDTCMKTPGRAVAPNAPPPLVGQHTEEVLRDVAGYEAGDIARLRSSGAI